MSWSYSPALVEAFSEACCSGTEPSALSNTTPMPDQFYWPDKPTEHSRLSRFGTMCEPLTGSRGEELLTWFLEDSRARTSVQQELGQALTAPGADSGQKWQGSFARYSPGSSSWKTAQCSLLEGLDEFSETWPRWGSMRNGVSYLRPTAALPTFGNAYGSWPTPTANCGTGPGHAGREGGFNLQTAVRYWPTPTATDGKGAPSLESVKARALESTRGVRLPEALARDGDIGQLNPNWVEWLMGWPIGFSDLKPLETARFREFVQQHGGFSPVNEAA